MAPAVPIGFTGQRESKKCFQSGAIVKMGKTRKVSKGVASGFIPDYRHAVETMAESEEFGSSGRVDTEMTASEDSCAPKRKCISVNGDNCGRFGVCVEVLSLSKMSQTEKKNLELRLKSELDQVRLLQNRLASMSSNFVQKSPSSDIHSCSEGQKRPPVIAQKSVSVSVPHGKKRAPPGKNGARAKKLAALPSNTSNTMLMKQFETLLNRLMSHQFGWVFNDPVDTAKLNIPDYYNVIKHPMDFGTVKSKLRSGQYVNPLRFAADVRLTFSNAMTYNPPGNDVHFMAETLSKYFEMRWKPIEKKLPVAFEEPASSKSGVLIETEAVDLMPPSKRTKTTSSESYIKQEPIKRVMADVEKHKLSTELEALLAELPDSIINFLKESSSNASHMGEDEIEIDIDALSDDTLFTLRRLLDEFLLSKQKSQATAEPCELELNNESGLSNSSVQPRQGNDHADKDVDIGGNDPPVSSFPHVEIEKDGILRNSKCSGASSASSESGSLSSDSDSGSSSGGDSDGEKASVPEPFTSAENIEQKRGDNGNPAYRNHSPNGLSKIEQNCQSEPASVEAEDHQEGGNAPSERQVSPDKLYRAALLKSRFADTILKAQEKTLEKGEKQDPEKLRLEREELERRRREEKARLQAEAKAAEEVRRNAEAKAAAEAKRKRELEREAARQALQQMEKTVDINENCQFLEDLEMLTAVPGEELPSYVEETSPDHSQSGLGSFKLQGSNPLEQLGLYMKDDEEEEEEGQLQIAPDVVNEAEGEID